MDTTTHPPAVHPSTEPPIAPENLPALTPLICAEHRQSTDLLGRTLLAAGWMPEQVVHVGRHWPWTWMARAVGAERRKRGQAPADLGVMRWLWLDSPEGKLAAAVAAEEHAAAAVTADATERSAGPGPHAIVI